MTVLQFWYIFMRPDVKDITSVICRLSDTHTYTHTHTHRLLQAVTWSAFVCVCVMNNVFR